MRKVTLADVAREAGVSVQTASHVLSGNPTVRLPESTRQRVREAAAKVGYQPNRLAQAMRSGKTNMVSVWMPFDRPNLGMLQFLHAINSVVRQDGFDLMMVGLDSEQAYGTNTQVPHQWPVDGLISIDAGRAVKQFRSDPVNQTTPVSILGFELFPNGDSVSWDLVGASRGVTARLLELGARRVVHATLDWVLRDFPMEQRRRGYREQMEEAGLTPEFVPISSESSGPAETDMLRYLASNPMPEAVFCMNDNIALGVARAVKSMGARIPDDCIVWGHGNYPEVADHPIPISTIALDREAVARQAWTWLKERIENPSIPTRSVVLEMELIEKLDNLDG